MKLKCILFYFILTICLISTSSLHAQLTNAEKNELFYKVDKAIGNLQTVVYKLNYNTKFFARRDTIFETAICSLRIAPKDKLKAYNIVDFEYKDAAMHTFGHRKYDGNKALWITYFNLDSLHKAINPEIFTKKRQVRAVVENYQNSLLEEYLFTKNPMGSHDIMSGLIPVTEETLHGTPVYVIHIKYVDTADYKDNVAKHYIRKSDYLPIAYYSTMKWENMEQYRYYEVDYLAINPDLPVEAFTVSKEEKIDGEQRYQAFKEKQKTK
ncbi:hypothetical protein CHU92_08520 [Flavobacterium cyanobacteriorum]|uniref:DUF1571 domain-containing protein n=1 Tax=Flavobacterium cyanobacteriorum TaxID=2022802 RepID=A0A255Z7B7_9FLAO|nr:hypothetical protein [Flavobacterium cyanobacteriorum]OYQ37329.1 hypothetical protein CHU92_08520 [Flavobacterium cyanobacteriorum]